MSIFDDWLDSPVGLTRRNVRQEIVKQAIDQPLHFLWAAAGTILPFLAIKFAHDELLWLVATIILAAANAAVIVLREWRQWPPSKRPWDPFVDWTFYALGAGAAVTLGLTVLR